MTCLKLNGDLDYMDIVVPRMMEYIKNKNGIKCGHAKNHHTVEFTLNTGETLIAHAYEAETMIVINWYSYRKGN